MIMETEREDTTNVELFWTLFNEALVKVANDPSIQSVGVAIWRVLA